MTCRFDLYRLGEWHEIECHGDLLEAAWIDATGALHCERTDRPHLGAALRLSSTSLLGKSPAHEVEWWLTTPITAIVEDHMDRVVFRTQNSTYEWRVRTMDDAST